VGRGRCLVADQHRRRAIDDARGIARMVYMVDALHLRVALQRHRVEAHAAQLFERGFERGQAFERGLRLDELVLFQDGQAQKVLHRHHRLFEIPCCTCGSGAALGFDGVGVHVGTREAVERGDQVRADALGHEQRGRVGVRVLCPGTAIGADGNAAHALHASRHHQVFPARAHLLRGQVHGLQARRAKAVDLQTRSAEVPTRLERRYLGQHRTLLTHGRDDAHDDVVHGGGVKTVAALQLGQQAGEQADGFDLVQAAVLLALAPRRADGIEHIGLCHGVSPVVAAV